MNYMCEILENKKIVKIDYLRVHPINLRTNRYLLYRIYSWQLFQSNNFLIFYSYQLTATSSQQLESDFQKSTTKSNIPLTTST
jgi:hypothetical protein